MKPLLQIVAASLLLISCSVSFADRTNILFIVIDDLRPELGVYGNSTIISPNIDKLASQGLRFNHAYSQQAVCAPSRISLLSGRRPDTTGIYYIGTLLHNVHPEFVSLPRLFKNNGYETVSIGKVYHSKKDDPEAWSAMPWKAYTDRFLSWHAYLDKKSLATRNNEITTVMDEYNNRVKMFGVNIKKPDIESIAGPSHEAPDVADNAYPDGMIADKAIKELQGLKDKPFFMAVGFHKPHLPFNAPARYWDHYDRDAIKLPTITDWPKNMPDIAASNWNELRAYSDIPVYGNLEDEKARTLIHGYYACVSYVDAQVGRLLDELDRLKLRDKTIVILWSDHGWKLGEYSAWSKNTNFELDTRVPMILSVPGRGTGKVTNALVELVDVAPTLAELVSLPVPKDWEGTSMAPLLLDPGQNWKSAAFSQYPRDDKMGYAMRTERYRYIEWLGKKDRKIYSRELYDYSSSSIDQINIADRPEYAKLVEQLHIKLEEGWKAAMPQNAK